MSLAALSFLVVGCSAAATSTGTSSSSIDNSGNAQNGDDPGASSGTSGSSADSSGSSTDATNETCTATFRWLQKDAYKNTPGRTDPAWPPHTTTQIDVACVDASGNSTFTTTAYRENHGTTPGTTDANGTPMLDEMKNEQTTASRATLLSFIGTYAECECAPQTQFLSLDSVETSTEQDILTNVTSYVSAHLECDGDTSTADLVTMLQNGDYDDAFAVLPTCSWDAGYGWADAFTQAASSVLSSLAAYHVCNNDAQLEASMWSTLKTSGQVVACDNTSAICAGPSFFYTP